VVRDLSRTGSPIHVRTRIVIRQRGVRVPRRCRDAAVGARRAGPYCVDIPGRRRRTWRPRRGLRWCAHVVGGLPATSCRLATGCVRITHQARQLPPLVDARLEPCADAMRAMVHGLVGAQEFCVKPPWVLRRRRRSLTSGRNCGRTINVHRG
jgi:hypothetical protein